MPPISTLNQLMGDALSVSLDVSKLAAAGEFLVVYTPSVPSHINTNNLTFETRNPQQITVEIGKLHSKLLPIELSFRGSVAEGYQAGRHTISPEGVTLNGSIDALAKVDKVVVILEQEDLSQRFLGELPLVLLDADGEELIDHTIDLSEDSAFVTLPIVVEREIPLVVTYTPGGGATEDNISNVVLSPETITVSGSEEDMAGLDEISLGSIDLGRVTEEREFTFPIALDPSLTNVSGITEATVTVTIAGLDTQTFDVTNLKTTNVPDGYLATITTQMIPVIIRGTEEDLLLIDESQIRIVADLSDVTTIGSTAVPVSVYLDAAGDVGVSGEYTMVVSITEE